MMTGFVGALEEAILDPTLILRFVRRNVDVLGYPDFLIGMIRVRNRVLLFSHHDKIGNQLLQLVRSKVEEDVRREETEIEREEDEDEEVGVSRPTPVHVRIRGPTRPGTPHAIPGTHRYEVLINSRATAPILRSIAARAVDRVAANNGGKGTKVAGVAAVPENKKSGNTGIPTTQNSATTQAKAPNPQTSGSGSGKNTPNPVGQGANHGLSGDFVLSLITHSYHKYRSELLRLVESVIGG
jgi:hypothetical protein